LDGAYLPYLKWKCYLSRGYNLDYPGSNSFGNTYFKCWKS
jgi:hypothetical protein